MNLAFSHNQDLNRISILTSTSMLTRWQSGSNAVRCFKDTKLLPWKGTQYLVNCHSRTALGISGPYLKFRNPGRYRRRSLVHANSWKISPVVISNCDLRSGIRYPVPQSIIIPKSQNRSRGTKKTNLGGSQAQRSGIHYTRCRTAVNDTDGVDLIGDGRVP
ncbi:hypothetical protein BDM02DRAFT_2750295 [Thelephora ganbajun]|uniref:Uncharacterized protein n=1 Tax=Thelephora ganbajun TaxID=370292 RepID=A0ACB6ZTL0_THEGA|nr:hypothetical protein BDM02DRAFT_2750295 [Thelephora ganbajun]